MYTVPSFAVLPWALIAAETSYGLRGRSRVSAGHCLLLGNSFFWEGEEQVLAESFCCGREFGDSSVVTVLLEGEEQVLAESFCCGSEFGDSSVGEYDGLVAKGCVLAVLLTI